jgi:hypothetical protein
MNKIEKCSTVVLEDSAATEDLLGFDGEIGPHKRVADAISEIILSKEYTGGKMIGLEGGWGSGKSTVINLIKRKLSPTTSVSVFYFDAWAHEGDPLRRTFLESLIRHFKAVKWINNNSWDTKLDMLAKKRKEVTTETFAKGTSLGKFFGVSILFIPLGLVLLKKALDDGVTIDISQPFSISFLLGFALAVGPLVVLTCNAIRLFFKKEKHHSDWAFLAGETITQVNSQTSETPEPTSIEFEDRFRELMSEALKQTDRKVVIVLDNLDRVDSKYALSIWSTLQTFLQDRTTREEDWYTKIWIVIPYDPDGLKGLWSDSTQSFVEKSFQLRFEVPPLILSNWKRYLIGLLKTAFPKHANDTEELSKIYQVYNMKLSETNTPPTPRQIKVFVNRIGAIHRQWDDTIPLSHIAYYVTLKGQVDLSLAAQLRQGTIPSKRIMGLFDEDLKKNLAGLCYNFSPELAQQLLLRQPIIECYTKKDSRTLQHLEQVHGEGFWAVLEELATTGIEDFDLTLLSNAAGTINDTKWLFEKNRTELSRFVKQLGVYVLRLEKYLLTAQVGEGLGTLMTLDTNPQFTAKLIKSIKAYLQNSEMVSLDTQKDMVHGLSQIIGSAEVAGYSDVIESFVLPVEGMNWARLCTDLRKLPKEHWKYFAPKDAGRNLPQLFVPLIAQGKINGEIIDSIVVTPVDPNENIWVGFSKDIEQRFAPQNGLHGEEISLLIQTLFLLEKKQIGLANESLKNLSSQGFVFHWLYQIDPSNTIASSTKAWLMIVILFGKPKGGPTVHNGTSNAGVQHYESQMATGSITLASIMVENLLSIGESHLIFDAIEFRDSFDPLIVCCLQQIAKKESATSVFTPEIIIKHWGSLKRYLTTAEIPDAFTKLLAKLAVSTDLISHVLNSKFNLELEELYYELINSSQNQLLKDWLIDGCNLLTKDEWLLQFQKGGWLTRAMLLLLSKGQKVHLKIQLQDAIGEVAKQSIRQDERLNEQVRDEWPQIINALNSTERKSCRKRILQSAVHADGRIASPFFSLFGDEINDPVLLKSEDSVATLFTPIIREKYSLDGMRWVANILQAKPRLDQFSKNRDSIQEFIDRIKFIVESEDEEDEKVIEIAKISAALNGVDQ